MSTQDLVKDFNWQSVHERLCKYYVALGLQLKVVLPGLTYSLGKDLGENFPLSSFVSFFATSHGPEASICISFARSKNGLIHASAILSTEDNTIRYVDKYEINENSQELEAAIREMEKFTFGISRDEILQLLQTSENV